MSDTGVKSVYSYSDLDNAWNNEANIMADDATFADSTPVRNGIGRLYLSFDLSGIPSGATIDGIVLTVQSKVTDTGLALCARLIDDNLETIGVTQTATFSSADTEYSQVFGSSSYAWGSTDFTNWTGVAIYFYKTVTTLMTGYVDYATIQVYYTTASGPANVKTINGLAKASVKTICNLAIASSKTLDGIT